MGRRSCTRLSDCRPNGIGSAQLPSMRRPAIRLAIFALAFRVVSAVVAFLTYVIFPLDQREPFTIFGQASAFWDPFARYDSGWYYQIPRIGYVPDSVLMNLRALGAREPSAGYLRPNRRWRHELASNVRGLLRWTDRLGLLREVAFPAPGYMLEAYGMPASWMGMGSFQSCICTALRLAA